VLKNTIVTLVTFFAIFNSLGKNKKYENNSFPDSFKNPQKGDYGDYLIVRLETHGQRSNQTTILQTIPTRISLQE
jgi:hypothetical protein